MAAKFDQTNPMYEKIMAAHDAAVSAGLTEYKDPKTGLIATILYVLAMFTLAFHLLHGFQSAFQSIGLNSPKYTPTIKKAGVLFSIIVPLLFAIIPVYIHFFLK